MTKQKTNQSHSTDPARIFLDKLLSKRNAYNSKCCLKTEWKTYVISIVYKNIVYYNHL